MSLIELQMLGQLALAFILGGVIGLQRENQGMWAGPRTYALVTGGSALFTILSVTSFGGNNSQVAAAVVTGIGFLGAGTILHKENRVEGLTTAAGLWVVAAIGMAIGLKYYWLSVAASVLVLLILMFNDKNLKKGPKKTKK